MKIIQQKEPFSVFGLNAAMFTAGFIRIKWELHIRADVRSA